FTYTPTANYNGSDSFTYQVSDDGGTANGGQNTGNTVTVTLTIGSANDSTAVTSHAYITNADTTMTVNAATGVLANDSDPNDSPANPLIATLLPRVTTRFPYTTLFRSFTYTPTANYNGSDSFTYQVSDDGGTTNGGQNTGNTVTVTL